MPACARVLSVLLCLCSSQRHSCSSFASQAFSIQCLTPPLLTSKMSRPGASTSFPPIPVERRTAPPARSGQTPTAGQALRALLHLTSFRRCPPVEARLHDLVSQTVFSSLVRTPSTDGPPEPRLNWANESEPPAQPSQPFLAPDDPLADPPATPARPGSAQLQPDPVRIYIKHDVDEGTYDWQDVDPPLSAHRACWCNHDVLSSLGCRCPHPPGFHPSFAGKRNSDGSFATRQTACYPQPLAAAIASCIQPFLSLLPDPIKLPDWRKLLPPAFLWPAPGPRIEDGAGTSSSAFWGLPRETDFLRPLRSLWLKRLETPGLLSGVLSHMVSPSKDLPISPAALHLFESDLRTFLRVE